MRLFDILGPVMGGPSSSHTAGAVRIGLTARKLLGDEPVHADISLHGSCALTGRGHGTDCALIAGLERTLHHTPQARDAKVCKAEVRSDCMAGTLVVPQSRKNGEALRCGYLVKARRVVLVDATGVIESHLKPIMREPHAVNGGVGLLLYYFFEYLIAKDLQHL